MHREITLFDTFFGLPLHVFVLHATVMLIPMGALVTVAVVLRPKWREHYIGLLTGFNLSLLALTFVTVQAGEELQAQLGGRIAEEHEKYGRILLWIVAALVATSVVAWVVQRHDVPSMVRQTFAGLVAAVAVASGVQTAVVGHTGSDSKWGGTFDRERPAAPVQDGADESSAVEPLRIMIKNFKFVPADATVKRGQKVTVVNEDAAKHTLTANDGSFDTGLLGMGESKTIVVKKAGKNSYFCEPHQYMTGTFTVS